MPDYTMSIDIEAPPEIVFDHLVTPERMVTWMGEHARLEPMPGGAFAVDIRGTPVRGNYLEVDRPRRVVVSWGMIGSDDLPPGASRVEFTLTPSDTGTRLRLVHRGLPDSHMPGHGAGWSNYLGRLQLAAAGLDPGIDTFNPRQRTAPQ